MDLILISLRNSVSVLVCTHITIQITSVSLIIDVAGGTEVLVSSCQWCTWIRVGFVSCCIVRLYLYQSTQPYWLLT